MRALLVGLTIIVATPFFGGLAFLAALFGLPDVEGGVYDWTPRGWARTLLWAGGVKVHLHNPERISRGGARIYVSNHVSWYDVFALGGVLPRYKWIAKAELGRIPVFGAMARAAGMVFIDRNNRKGAFAQYDVAATSVRNGASVIVFPEGTRGEGYAIRPFKKGPFVLAVAAGVPIVPTVVFGTMAVHPKGSWRVRGGDVHVHFLEEISTEGYTYEQRDELADLAWSRMAETMKSLYGIDSGRSDERTPVAVGN